MTKYNGIFDSHAHYDDDKFNSDRDELIPDLFQNGVRAVINAASDMKSSAFAVSLSQKYPQMFACVGVHPHSASEVVVDPLYLKKLEQYYLENEKVVAIGEIGLDYHYDFSPREEQKKVFEDQLLLAKKLNAPVTLHIREATEDAMAILKKYRPRGVVHCFSGSAETAEESLNLGLYIGITGVATFKNAKKIIDVTKVVPLDRLLIETDAPYMAPVPHRGERCDSRMLSFVAEKLAELYDTSPQEIIDITRKNTCDIYNISL